MLNRTDKNNENNRGEINKKDLKNEIYPVWQGYVESNHGRSYPRASCYHYNIPSYGRVAWT